MGPHRAQGICPNCVFIWQPGGDWNPGLGQASERRGMWYLQTDKKQVSSGFVGEFWIINTLSLLQAKGCVSFVQTWYNSLLKVTCTVPALLLEYFPHLFTFFHSLGVIL